MRRGPAVVAGRGPAVVAATILLTLSSISPAFASTQTYDPASDAYSMASIARGLGADRWWKAGYTGAGVDVAVIDSGVVPVTGLDDSGKIIYGPDLSFESQSPDLRHLDTYGHGTFMAGLIAAQGDYSGIAPGARILSLKVATADGATDVSQVIAAIDWVVEHRTDNGLNVRVINLSYGTNSLQPAEVDPLAYAVEQAWKSGIVVVAAAGNSGYQRGHGAPGIADPAYDPLVIGVGAADTGKNSKDGDDRAASFSASASSGHAKPPDFLAPGAHLQGLRVPNGYLDVTHPEGALDARFFRGSGTSEATAIASGAIALILEKYPTLTPDQVKHFITANAHKLKGANGDTQGAGEIDLEKLLGAKPASYKQKPTTSDGTGLLEESRGEDHVSDGGVVLEGEQDIFGAAFDSASMAAAEAAGNTWTGGVWNGNTWTGNTWTGNTWAGNTWTGNTWAGNTWTGNTWAGNTWTGNTWATDSWAGNTWTGNTWTGNTWATDSWS